MASIIGAVLKGKKVGQKLLREFRIKHGGRGKTITSVKPMSGKIPPWVGAGGKDPKKRAEIVKTHLSVERSKKISDAAKKAKEGKEELKHLEATGQAEELKNYKGKGTGIFHKKGFK